MRLLVLNVTAVGPLVRPERAASHRFWNEYVERVAVLQEVRHIQDPKPLARHDSKPIS